jgi:hypothetical protein
MSDSKTGEIITIMTGNNVGKAFFFQEEFDKLVDKNTNLRLALNEVMEWINNWNPSFTEDEEWSNTRNRVKAALEN